MTWLRSMGLRMVLALGLALMLWVFVSFSENPDRSIPFENVSVTLEGLAPGLLVVDKEGLPRESLPSVDVLVTGDTETLREMRESDLFAYVDMTGLGPGQRIAPISVKPTRPGLARLDFSPDPTFLPLRIEQIITRTVPLTIEVRGDVPFSFEKGVASAIVRERAVAEVQISGPQNRVDRVTHVRATANVAGFTANYRSPRPLEAVGEDEQPIAGVTIAPDSVDVLVPINSSVGIKRVPVLPQVVGRPGSGYIVTDVAVDPQLVSLTGSSGPLNRAQSISTAPVDLAGASQTFTRTVALVAPPATILRDGVPSEAVVTVRIAMIDRPFQITLPVPVQISGGGGLPISYSPQVVRVTLSGSGERLAALDPAALQASVSARGLRPGTYTLAPTIALPPGIALAGNPPAVTITIQPPPSPVPQATAPPTDTSDAGPPTVEPTASPTASPTAAAAPTGTAQPSPEPPPTAAPPESATASPTAENV